MPPSCCCSAAAEKEKEKEGEEEGKSDFGRGCVGWHCVALQLLGMQPLFGHIAGSPRLLAMAEGTALCVQCAQGFALPPAACASRRPNRQAGHSVSGW